MKLFPILFFFGSLVSAIAAPPQVLELPPSVVAAGTTTTVDGEPWAYVIWNATDENWYEGARTSVFLSTNGGTSFTEQATMSLLTDPGAITPWISRAGSLGEDLAESEELSQFLFEQWGEEDQQLPADFPTLLSTFTTRAAQDPRSANALRQVGQSRPLFRFLTGTGWAGPLGVGQGQDVIIELRDQQGSVVGRVELTAGENPALPAPGAPVHVEPAFPDDLPVPAEVGFPAPPSTTQVDRSISLRWAVPEALRSQILLTRGFYLWRLAPGYTPPGGMTGPALVAAEGNGQVTRVIEDAAVASKIFKPAGSAESGPDVADLASDPDTWFVADDNRRFDDGGVPFDEGDAFDYVVAPVDLLGRVGAVSGRGSGVAAHFIPPTVPDVHRVENTMVEGQQRLRVVWKANSNDLPGEAPVTHYLILRSRAANEEMAADEVRRSSDSARHGELIYLGVCRMPRMVR